jgi:hypothetical protein
VKRIPPAKWLRIKSGYEKGTSISKLSRKFNVSANSIRARRDRGTWTLTSHGIEEVTRNSSTTPQRLGEAVRSKVVNDAAATVMQNPETIAALDNLADTLETQVTFACRLTRIADRILTDAETGQLSSLPPEYVSAVFGLCSAASLYARTCAGLRVGQPSSVNREKLKVRRFEVVPHVPKPKTQEEAAPSESQGIVL